jgi:hypothetical protein
MAIRRGEYSNPLETGKRKVLGYVLALGNILA